MGLHINEVKGDFVFLAWVENEDARLKAKEKELDESGYFLKEEDGDYLNSYYHYENKAGDKKTITICCS